MKKLFTAALALLFAATAHAQSYPSPTYNNVTVQGALAVNGTFTATGKVGLGSLAAQAANTVVANVTASSATPTAVAIPSCNAANSAVQYVSNTGWSCGTSFGLTTGTLAQFASTTSAQFASVISDETGTGSVVLGTGPTISNLNATGTPTAPTATTGTNTTQLATTAFVNSSITASSANGRLIGIQIFTSSGTYTPDTGTNSVIVEVQAASGGAAGVVATTSTQAAAGSGAGAGAYAKVRYTSGFSGASITIGAPGTAGGSGTAGGNASATTFGSLISCPGGNAGGLGAAISVVGGSAEPAAATAAPTISGGTTILSVAGAGTLPAQAIQTSGTQAIASSGASSMLGTGGTQTVVNTSAPVVGNGYGAGPSGGINTGTASAQSGKAGQPAIVIVYEYS